MQLLSDSPFQLFSDSPWLLIVVMALLIPIVAIIFSTLTTYWQKTRLAELDAALKQEMLQRGMSAEEIVRVINARKETSKGCRHKQVPSQETIDYKS